MCTHKKSTSQMAITCVTSVQTHSLGSTMSICLWLTRVVRFRALVCPAVLYLSTSSRSHVTWGIGTDDVPTCACEHRHVCIRHTVALHLGLCMCVMRTQCKSKTSKRLNSVPRAMMCGGEFNTRASVFTYTLYVMLAVFYITTPSHGPACMKR